MCAFVCGDNLCSLVFACVRALDWPWSCFAVRVFVYVFRTVDLGYVGVRALCELTAYWRLCMCVHVPYANCNVSFWAKDMVT